MVLVSNFSQSPALSYVSSQSHDCISSSDLDMAFISPSMSSRDLSFSVADDHMGSDHFPIQISLDKPFK